MNKATVLLLVTTIIASVTATYLGWTVHNERARFAAASGTLAAVAPSATTQQTPPGSTPSHPRAAPAAHGEVARSPVNVQSLPRNVSARSVQPPESLSRARNRSSASADLAYRRLELEQRYSDAAAALNLQTDEATRFFDLLAQQEHHDAAWEMSSEGSGKGAQRERQRRQDANKAEQAGLLGEARMADWNKYLNSLGARAEVRELRIQLADSDYPLRRDQYEPLVALLATEEVRHTGEREELRRAQGNTTGLPPEQVVRYMNGRMDLIEESLARRRRAAASVLDTEQLKRYQAMLELQRLRSQVEYDSAVTANLEAGQSNAGRTQ
jgi:hypothetical protein